MSSYTLKDTIRTAENGAGAAREAAEHAWGATRRGAETVAEGAEHTFASVAGSVLRGVSAAAGVAAMLRRFDLDRGLEWMGLARRRGPLASMALFGAGVATGAALGVLFAPMSGAAARRSLRARIGELTRQGAEAAERAESEIGAIEGKVEDLAGKVGEGLKKAERKVEERVVGAVEHAREQARAALAPEPPSGQPGARGAQPMRS